MKTQGLIAGGVLSLAIVASVVFFRPVDTFDIKIDGPTEVAAGELIVLDVSSTGADSYCYGVTPPLACRVFEKQTVLVASTPNAGEYLFFVSAAKNGQSALVQHTVTVGGAPAPAGFATRVKSAVASVQSPTKQKDLETYSSWYATIASQGAAGIFDSVEHLHETTRQMVREGLGANLEAWAPVRKLIADECLARVEAGTLSTLEDHVRVWKEIAAALREAGK